MTERQHNWAGNYAYSAASLHYPETIEQLRELVGRSRALKVLGSRHSFNGIADTTGDLVSLEKLEPVVALDRQTRTVTVSAGVRYGQLCRQLQLEGYALHNMASLPHISVGGACATATHGSGDRHGNLATAVRALELVTADGEVTVLSREQHGEQFQGAVVGLGGLGVVTRLTLEVEPAYAVRQEVYENLRLAQLEEHFEEIVSSAYSVSLFTDWQGESVDQVWLKRQVTDDAAPALAAEFFGAAPATGQRHPISSMPSEACTPQMGVPGPWNERLPHFRMDHTPSSGEELQSEYLLPREHAVEAVRAVARLQEHLAPLLQISEVRTVAADGLWMSPCYRHDCVAFHFTWHKDWPAVRKLLPLLEEQLAPFGARPHWGKLFTMPPSQVRSLYPRLPDFVELLRSHDPDGKFRNPFLDTYVFGVS
ncbi:MAG TPA: FAD-binding protein [Armatimonadota bacterium]|nr:FAD-binding protein [Armatimonadota bacterium]